MTDETRGNIKVDRETYERHNERRQELDVTWAEYLDNEAPEYTFAKEVQTVSRDELREIVREEMRAALEDVVGSSRL